MKHNGPYAKPDVEMICEHCGKGKMMRPTDARRTRFCSKECVHDWQRVEKEKAPKKELWDRICPICNKDYQANNRGQVYCSRECSVKKAQEARRVYDKKTRTCETCEMEFMPKNQNRVNRFCSWTCRDLGKCGENSVTWRGGRFTRSDGYVMRHVPTHPNFQHRPSGGRYIPEHRLVMEESLGRLLESWETVHHINGVKDDNRIENLQLRQGKHGKGVVMKCNSCGSHDITSTEIED